MHIACIYHVYEWKKDCMQCSVRTILELKVDQRRKKDKGKMITGGKQNGKIKNEKKKPSKNPHTKTEPSINVLDQPCWLE